MSPYRLTGAGPGDSARETTTGIRPHIGAPTGRTGLGDIPLTTPAAEAYQATPAVTRPTQPPAWSQYGLMPCATRKNPNASTISVISSVTKTPVTATLTRVAQNSMYVLKIANAIRNHASELSRSAPFSRPANPLDPDSSTTNMPSASQKPPYVENAVAPKTLRLRNSHIPASSWMRPP